MAKTRTLLLIALLLVGTLLAACGDDDDDSGDNTDSTPVATTAAGTGDATGTATTEPESDSEPTATVAPTEPAEATATEETEPTEESEPTATEPEATEPALATATSATGTGTAASPTAAVTPTIEAEGDPALVQQLIDAMIAIDEFPAGWTIWDTGPDDENEDDNICGIPNLKDRFPPIARAEVSYQGSELGPFVSQSIGALALTDAEGGMAEVESAFANCTTWTDPDGVEYTIEPLDVPELGEQGVARRVTAAQNGFTLIIEVVYTRDRNYVLAFAHYGVDEIDSALTVELVSTLMERIAALESLE